ncbi:MAG: pyridoxal-dependent decarboxylase [Myxococcota bacterium]
MTPDEFRKAGYAAIDWIAEYLETIEQRPVQSPLSPGEVRARLPASPPESPEPFEAVLRDLNDIIVPGVTHWQHPSFFAFFPANSSPPAILGELLSAGLGVQGMLWVTSPACTEVETHVLDWVVEALDLPARFRSDGPGGGVIQDTASSATLVGLLAARQAAGGVAEQGRMRLYTSSEAHSSLQKGARIAGFRDDQLVLVDTDDALGMRADALAEAMAADRARGLKPAFVCATVGTTSTTAVDDIPGIGAVTQEHGVWLHVDAAYAGSAAVAPELRFVNRGLEHADSYCFNPHKWLLTNFDCDCFFVADRKPLIEALSILPEYLRNQATEAGAVIDYRDWQIPLGRRFRALKLWMVFRSYGLQGLREHVRRHVTWGRQFASWVEADPRFQVVAEPHLGLVCFRHRGGDEANDRLIEALNATGRVYLTATRVRGQRVLRLAIGGRLTEERHVAAAWALVQSTVEVTGLDG